MGLSSPAFLSFFLPLCTAGLFILQKTRLKNTWLLLCSCVFFALCADLSTPLCCLVPLLAFGAWFLTRYGEKGAYAYVALALAALAAVKLLSPAAAWPVGLSFVALQGVSYALDAARRGREGSATDKPRLSEALLYTTFFPKLAAGPICRFEAFRLSLLNAKVTAEGLEEGLSILTAGLCKKLLLANRLLPLAKAGFSAQAHPLACLLTVIACPLYVYYDFSGYTDMARGVGLILGVRLPENFSHPFSAGSLRAFWRRWHITLSDFLRDYVYIPLGGNRKGRARTMLHGTVVFLLMGLWHGATLPYILFGLWHALFVALEGADALRPEKWPRALAKAYTLTVVALGFVLFLSPSPGEAAGVLTGLFDWNLSFEALQNVLCLLSPVKAAALFAALMLQCVQIPKEVSGVRLTLRRVGLVLLLVICFASAVAGGDMAFLYARF